MNKFSGAEDIYEMLVEKSDDSWLLGLVAFGLIEEQRIEWMKHQVEFNGGKPSSDEINAWYEQQADGVLLRARDTAETRLQDYFKDSMLGLEEDMTNEIMNGIIVNEIRDTKKFLPQLGVNVLGGVISAIILGLIVFALLNTTSFVDIGRELVPTKQENKNG